MRYFTVLLLLLFNSLCILSQSISTDANGKSVLLGGTGGSAGLDFQRAVFNANYCFNPKNRFQETSPLFGFSYTGSNKGGMTDLFQNGTSSLSSTLRICIGFTTSNTIGERFKDPKGYKNQLAVRTQVLDSLIKQIKTDSSYIVAAKQTFWLTDGGFANEVIKIYRKHYPYPKEIADEIWKIYNKSNKRESLDLYYDVKKYILSQVTEPLNRLKQYEIEKEQIKKQLETSISLPRNYYETTYFFSGGVNNFRFNSISRLTNNKIQIEKTGANNFVGMLGINHRFGKNWFLGYGLGFEVHDNFETLQRENYNSVTVSQGGITTVSNTIYGYSGNYISLGSTPFLLQLSFLTNEKDIGTIIYTPVYLSLGQRSQYGSSAAIVLKNNTSLGINIEELILSDKLTNKGTVRYLSFGFNFRYVLNDFRIK